MRSIARCREIRLALSLLALAVLAASPTQVQAKGAAYADPNQVDDDYAWQGEYVGQIEADGETLKIGLQVVALGQGQFTGVGYLGGLPGDGWDGQPPERAQAKLDNGVLLFQATSAQARIRDGKATVLDLDGQVLGTLEKTVRRSKTLGQKPPADAIVLFDGSSAENWQNGKLTDDHLLMQGTTSKQEFQSHRLHIEFRLPYQPEDRGQARGNSGLYLQGRYEVQMLDSFGLDGRNNEAGGIYEISDPAVNMCYPPLTWQTYDVEFHAARYDAAGQVVEHPRMSVWHNGVLVQDNVELPRATRAAPRQPGPEPGPVYLQDHGNPMRYRNIWVVPLRDQPVSVKPGINERFLDPTLDVSEWVERFEGESREVYVARRQVLEAIGLSGGDRVADVGAGTGMYTRLFARAVGPQGWVYAVDISPNFVQHISASSQQLGLENITAVLCDEDSVNLPPESVDVVFICDTYHHFEYPQGTLRSIQQALKPGGKLALIDFERIPGVSRDWTLGHVRAGKEVFQAEVEQAGLKFEKQVMLDEFKENYFLLFRKP